MGKNKQITIIIILVSLLISALGVGFYFYKEKEKIIKNEQQVMYTFIAKENMVKGHKIEETDLLKIKMAKKYLLTSPLTKKEIVGKYTARPMYKHDIFRKEDVVSELSEFQRGIIKSSKYSYYNAPFAMFKNPDYSLKIGDRIDIISIYPVDTTNATSNKKTTRNKVQFAAENIEVLGFMRDGMKKQFPIEKVTEEKLVKGKKVEETYNAKAEEVVIDISKKNILNLLEDYNKGYQLWLVKKRDYNTQDGKALKNEDKNVKYKKYVSKNKTEVINARIYFGDEKDPTIVSNVETKLEGLKECELKNKYLVVLKEIANLRKTPSLDETQFITLERNTIITYDKKLDKNWYKTCDGLYVEKGEIVEITNEKQKELLK